MGGSQSEQSPRQTRRRGVVLEQAILDAAWAEVAEAGWDGFTIDGVAARAGTAKAVIYRRWSNRHELAVEMLSRVARIEGPRFVSSGSLRSDLITFTEGMAGFLRGPFGAVARGVTGFESRVGEGSLFGDAPVIGEVAAIVSQALERGELGAAPPALAVNVGHAVIMAEFLQSGRVPDADAIVLLVDAVWVPALRSATSTAPA